MRHLLELIIDNVVSLGYKIWAHLYCEHKRKEKKLKINATKYILTDIKYTSRQLLSKLEMITFLHFTVFPLEFVIVEAAKFRFKVTKVQTGAKITLFFSGYSPSFDKKMK